MTEALAQLHGFAGVRDGLVLLRRLVGECWERLSPPIEEPDDVDRRAAALFWLDDPDRGSRFPTTVRQLGIVSYEGTPFGWTQWKQIQEAKGGSNAATFEQAIAATPWERCQAVSTDITEAVQELTTLVQVAGEKMGKSAPSLINLRGALEGCQTLGQQILQRKAPPAAEPVAAENGTAPSTAPATNGAARPTRQGTTRQDVYQQLAQSATLLQQMEPHSPIPYLILRAVQLGSMSFPDLMRALIRDGNVLSELSRELGIKEPETTN
jgi:type VI secretion system protein ImpA